MIVADHIKALIDMFDAFGGEEDIQEDIGRAIVKATAKFVKGNDGKEDAKPATHEEMTDAEHNLAKEGKKISAIKEIRNRTGLGVRESKELYEKFYPYF